MANLLTFSSVWKTYFWIFSFPLLTLSRNTGGFTAELDFSFNEQDKDVYPRPIELHSNEQISSRAQG